MNADNAYGADDPRHADEASRADNADPVADKGDDADAEQQPPATTFRSYAEGRLARAFVTAHTHADPATRDRAQDRIRGWRQVLAGVAAGTLRIGSRTPVSGLPAWVTPEVLHGGFATGSARAEGPLLPYETAAARRAGVPEERAALFAHYLTEPGLRELWDLLDSGRYEVTLPEEAALLTVAWLVREGTAAAALELVLELSPFADRLRFTPRPAEVPAPRPGAVHRRTVGDAVSALVRRELSPAVEAQREALTIWRPFTDDLLRHWLETATPDGREPGRGPDREDEREDGRASGRESGREAARGLGRGSGHEAVREPGGESGREPVRVLDREPDAGWRERGAELLARYARLARQHTRCGRHRDPKSNEGILRAALEETVAGRPLDARRLGLLRHAVASMVRKRGLPGSARHAALRRAQAAQAALPSHRDVALVVAERLSDLPQQTGVADIEPLVAPVTRAESERTGLPTGTAVPSAVRRHVEGALSAPLATLVARGIVPSAEAMAELVPPIVAEETAAAYPDLSLRTLMAAHYRAFRNRRSLLLLDLQRQVRPEELPWVRAVEPYRREEGVDDGAGRGRRDGRAAARAAVRELAEAAMAGFPGTLLPNPLVRELSVLVRRTGDDAPLVEELAADIFMGTFARKFLTAADIAAELLGGGSLYERYYGIDYAAVRALAGRRGDATGMTPEFAALCHERAGSPKDSWSVAANGTVIEQAQILTTHNLATLVHRFGAEPEPGWAELARRCHTTVCRLTERAQHTPYPLATLKDTAYAWRQMVFHLSLCEPAERDAFLARLPDETARHRPVVAARLAPALEGLRLVAAGGSFADDGTADAGRARRLTGWTVSRHWLHPASPVSPASSAAPS
ncbi:hypothetical protein ACFY7C_17310 [Streptomyces sp. NPDC012769]|uniref:hypothetical protein n=1 Tax=Streptomyces sp. NPDC012769 TaxID=3364848 RepID=UPI0036930F17